MHLTADTPALMYIESPGRRVMPGVGRLRDHELGMKKAPNEIDGARVILYTPIDGRHRHTENCRQIVAGELMGPAAGLAICQYEGENSYYLFGCDEDWGTITDTWHETLEEAKAQAEFEYEGVNATWQKPGG